MPPELDVVIADPRWEAAGIEALAERAADTTLAQLGLAAGDFEICVLACDDSRIAALNAQFRGRATPTNVLSWPSAERGAARDGDAPAAPAPGALGDIAIAHETCAREAAAAGKPLADHATHLLVHGILHLMGYDHERDRDAALMEAREARILARLGVADPYSAEGA